MKFNKLELMVKPTENVILYLDDIIVSNDLICNTDIFNEYGHNEIESVSQKSYSLVVKLSSKSKNSIRYKILKERGICVKCGYEQATMGIYCDECSNYQYEKVKEIREERYKKGLCIICGKKKTYRDNDKKHYKMCKKCREHHKEQQIKGGNK